MNTDKKYKLPKAFAEKWIKALRSGEYEQTQEVLCKNNSFCCLGVACKILGSTDERLIGHGETTSHLIDILDISDFPEELMDTELMNNFIDMNDEAEMSFFEIADWIERNVELYEEV